MKVHILKIVYFTCICWQLVYVSMICVDNECLGKHWKSIFIHWWGHLSPSLTHAGGGGGGCDEGTPINGHGTWGDSIWDRT